VSKIYNLGSAYIWWSRFWLFRFNEVRKRV